jgi:hypothetical protein
MASDLDDIRELAEDFATELRRKNRSQRTIDGYLQHIEYFAAYLEANQLPTAGPDITRDHVGGYIESLLTRKNLRTGEPLSPEYARASTEASNSYSSTCRRTTPMCNTPDSPLTLFDIDTPTAWQAGTRRIYVTPQFEEITQPNVPRLVTYRNHAHARRADQHQLATKISGGNHHAVDCR